MAGRLLAADGHSVVLHARNKSRADDTRAAVSARTAGTCWSSGWTGSVRLPGAGQRAVRLGARAGRLPGPGPGGRGHADLVRAVLGDDRHRHRGGRARHHRQRPDRAPAGRAPRLRDPGHPGRAAHAARGQRVAAAGAGRGRRPAVRRGQHARVHRRAADRPGLGRRRQASRRTAWPPGTPPTRPSPRAPRRSWPDRLPGCRSSTWAPSTSPGTPPAPEPPTGRPCGPPTSGSGGWWRRSAPGRPVRQEDWTIVVVTDHGHLDEGGHGGREPEVATAWAAAAGPGHPAGRPAAGHAAGGGGAAGSGRSRLPRASRVSAQARTTPTPTAAPPTASLKVCAPMRHHGGRRRPLPSGPPGARAAAAAPACTRSGGLASSTAKLAASAKLLVACPLGKACPDGLADGRLEHVVGNADRDGHGQRPSARLPATGG